MIGFAVIFLAFFYLLWSSFMGSFKFAVTPSEFEAKKAQYVDKIIKLSGIVEKGSIKSDLSDYSFNISDESHSIPVHYKGVIANTFREGAEVVVTGKYDEGSHFFEATELLTKCASKYEGS